MIWLALHPDAFASTAQRYALYDSKQLSALQGLREFLSFQNIERMTSIYWSFLSPSLLFLSGDQLITFSTRQAGVFPMIMAVLLLLGMVQVIERERSRFAWLVVAGFLIAPLPAVLVPENGAVNRATALLPFGVLLASYGIKWLWSLDVIRHARTAGPRRRRRAHLSSGWRTARGRWRRAAGSVAPPGRSQPLGVVLLIAARCCHEGPPWRDGGGRDAADGA